MSQPNTPEHAGDDAPPLASLQPIGYVESSLIDLAQAPRQPDEDAPPAVLRIDPPYEAALTGLAPGHQVIIVTWLHVADRHVLTVHPRSDRRRRPTGVFATRSPDRPNPIGLHRATITAIDRTAITVDHLEAIDRTPVLDIKPVLGPMGDR